MATKRFTGTKPSAARRRRRMALAAIESVTPRVESHTSACFRIGADPTNSAGITSACGWPSEIGFRSGSWRQGGVE
jgi:hypothetical protein